MHYRMLAIVKEDQTDAINAVMGIAKRCGLADWWSVNDHKDWSFDGQDGNVKPVADLTPDDIEDVYAVVCDHGYFGGNQYRWRKLARPYSLKPSAAQLKADFGDSVAVVVNAHN